MGAKNCPETPRQKMIGMMYLVLTAMLALNVSADVLDAFTKVQQGLTSTIANFTKKNADLYNDIEMAYNLNQTKVAAVREKTNEIRKSTQELVDYIEQLKYKMVVLADGEEDADVMNIKAKDNLDIGGQVMVLQGKGKELREMITAYREQLSGLIADKDSVLKNSVLTHLATDDPKPVDGEFKSWEVSKFEGIPLVGVVTLLTMYQADILSTESDVVKYLFSSMDAESFKFNKLEALVIPESRYILKGDKIKDCVDPKDPKERKKNFLEFNKKIANSKHFFSFSRLQEFDKYDYYFVGSDQIWNPIYGGLSDLDLLTFTQKKKIAISASFGIE